MRLEIKTTIILLLLLAVIVLSTCKGCLQKKYDKLKTDCASQTERIITKHDTVIIHEQATFVDHAPIPIKTDNPKVTVRWHFDTLYVENFNNITDTIFVDTLVSYYYATNYYKKNFQSQYGTFTTFDTVNRNGLVGNGLAVDLSIPSTTKTVYKSKAALYFGIDVYGNKSEPINGAGFSMMYQSPKALNYQVGAYFTSEQSLNFRGSILFPLTKK
jgi:hypothetical protein